MKKKNTLTHTHFITYFAFRFVQIYFYLLGTCNFEKEEQKLLYKIQIKHICRRNSIKIKAHSTVGEQKKEYKILCIKK